MNQIQQVVDDLATCLCAQIETDGTPVCFCGVLPGETVALEYAGDCQEACGMAWVRVTTIYPSVTIGVLSPLPGNCSVGIGLDVEMAISRCLPVGNADGSGPSQQELADAAALQQADMLTMWRAVACCRQSKDWMLGQYTPFGPEGGLVGGTITVSILVT